LYNIGYKKEGYKMKNYLDVQNGYKNEELKEIAMLIKNGGIVLFPTETVYGIGTNGLDEKAVQKLYKVKKRDTKNPINLLVSSMSMIEEITKDISPIEYKLMETFFPGPFTIILKRKNIIPNIVTANSDFVGIRMPSSEISKKLVEFAGVPIAAPSANISGKPSGTNLLDIKDEFSNQLDFIVNGGESRIGIESTIVKVIDDIPHVLRPGFITPEQIKKVIGNVVLESSNNNILPSSNIKHYQLDIKSILIYSENTRNMIDTILSLSKKYKTPAIICCTENIKFYSAESTIKNIIPITSKCDLEKYSKNLFSSLRKASSFSPDVILIEGVKKEGLGIAIMNRLLNVCDNNYIEK
jgi:L-threonylcarbamoyladenylate synthase